MSADLAILWHDIAEDRTAETPGLELTDEDRGHDAAILPTRQDFGVGGTRIDPVAVGTETLVASGCSVVEQRLQIGIGGAEHGTHIYAEHAMDTRVVAGVRRHLIDVVEHVDRTNGHARGAADTLAGRNDLVHEEVDCVETSAVEFGSPRVRPVVRVGRLIVHERAIRACDAGHARIEETRGGVDGADRRIHPLHLQRQQCIFRNVEGPTESSPFTNNATSRGGSGCSSEKTATPSPLLSAQSQVDAAVG